MNGYIGVFAACLALASAGYIEHYQGATSYSSIDHVSGSLPATNLVLAKPSITYAPAATLIKTESTVHKPAPIATVHYTAPVTKTVTYSSAPVAQYAPAQHYLVAPGHTSECALKEEHKLVAPAYVAPTVQLSGHSASVATSQQQQHQGASQTVLTSYPAQQQQQIHIAPVQPSIVHYTPPKSIIVSQETFVAPSVQLSGHSAGVATSQQQQQQGVSQTLVASYPAQQTHIVPVQSSVVQYGPPKSTVVSHRTLVSTQKTDGYAHGYAPVTPVATSLVNLEPAKVVARPVSYVVPPVTVHKTHAPFKVTQIVGQTHQTGGSWSSGGNQVHYLHTPVYGTHSTEHNPSNAVVLQYGPTVTTSGNGQSYAVPVAPVAAAAPPVQPAPAAPVAPAILVQQPPQTTVTSIIAPVGQLTTSSASSQGSATLSFLSKQPLVSPSRVYLPPREYLPAAQEQKKPLTVAGSQQQASTSSSSSSSSHSTSSTVHHTNQGGQYVSSSSASGAILSPLHITIERRPTLIATQPVPDCQKLVQPQQQQQQQQQQLQQQQLQQNQQPALY